MLSNLGFRDSKKVLNLLIKVRKILKTGWISFSAKKIRDNHRN